MCSRQQFSQVLHISFFLFLNQSVNIEDVLLELAGVSANDLFYFGQLRFKPCLSKWKDLISVQKMPQALHFRILVTQTLVLAWLAHLVDQVLQHLVFLHVPQLLKRLFALATINFVVIVQHIQPPGLFIDEVAKLHVLLRQDPFFGETKGVLLRFKRVFDLVLIRVLFVVLHDERGRFPL